MNKITAGPRPQVQFLLSWILSQDYLRIFCDMLGSLVSVMQPL